MTHGESSSEGFRQAVHPTVNEMRNLVDAARMTGMRHGALPDATSKAMSELLDEARWAGQWTGLSVTPTTSGASC